MKSRASDIRNEDVIQMTNDHKMRSKNSGSKQRPSRVEEDMADSTEVGKSSVSQYDSTISICDEFAENGKCKAMGVGLSTSVGYGYEIGDMVWGKVKSHPWWPGHIYNEAFASSSVRRMKRAGLVLVAFFGDSSYGWFDPAELIPFDTNFSEKSRQTNSRTFVKAVEEAVGEASRRRGLGLACRCRNPYNFRPTDVEGYFAVDLGDYEPGGVYSVTQIGKARESFQPKDTLAFMKQLALMPTSDGYNSIDFIMNKTVASAYRKAVFEEFDETYAQAFGAKPVRPCRETMKAVAQPVRAPLSGPLVIAEALGKRKNLSKPNKAKDQANKDRYLFKRRDEPSELKIQQIGQTTSSVQPAYVVGSVELTAGDYMVQKRAPAVSTKQQIPEKLEQMATIGMDGSSVSSRDVTGEKVVTIDDKPAVVEFSVAGSLANGSKVEPPAGSLVSQGPAYTSHFIEPKSSFDKGKGAPLEVKEQSGDNALAGPTIMDASGLSGKGTFHGGIDDMLLTSERVGDATINLQQDQQSSTPSKLDEDFQKPPSLPVVVEEVHGQEQFHIGGNSGRVLPTIDAKVHGQDSRMRIDTGAKKAKLLKRPVGELGAEKSVPGEKKKRRKELAMEMSSDCMQKRAATGKDDGASSSLLPDSLRTQPMVGMGNIELKLPQLLSDLQALALNPFHGAERNGSAIIQQVFLKFRSVVFQKSLAQSTPAEIESDEVNATKSAAGGTVGSDNPPHEKIRDLPSSKPPKPPVRPGDPTKVGRKRGPSDRQEELTAKRLKKINDVKSLAAEKKAAQKDGKETVVLRHPKPLKPDSVKKTESPAKTYEPTMLVMKFPPETTLPSGSELKARLARFGPLDHSSTRIFWQSSTCRVVFNHRVDAEAAHRHFAGNNTLFGNVNVRCHIRSLGAPAPESESKVQREDSAVEQKLPAAMPPPQQPSVQLKSCLKKSVGDEVGTPTGSNGGGRGTPRVKFMLVGGESSNGEENLMVGNKNNFNNASFGDGGTISSSHGIDFDSKNFQKHFIPPPSPPVLLPAQFPNALNNFSYAEAIPRNTHNFNNYTAPAVPRAKNMDIAQQMLSLLTKCNDVVTNMRSSLGYVPYYPL